MRVGYSLIVAPALIALALSCATAAPARAGNRNDADAEKLGFKLSLQCYTFRQLTFFETVDKAAELGIKYLEIYPGQKLKPGSKLTTVSNMSDEVLQEIQKKLADAGGLKVVAYGVAGVPTDEPGLRKTFDWAMFWSRTEHVNWPPEKVLAACKDHCKLIGSCSDTGHWMRANRVPVDMLKMLQGRVEHLHFKDLDQFGMKGQDVPWGTGKGNPKAMMQELQRQGFHGYFSIEYEHGTVPELMVNLARCVEFFDKTAGELAR